MWSVAWGPGLYHQQAVIAICSELSIVVSFAFSTQLSDIKLCVVPESIRQVAIVLPTRHLVISKSCRYWPIILIWASLSPPMVVLFYSLAAFILGGLQFQSSPCLNGQSSCSESILLLCWGVNADIRGQGDGRSSIRPRRGLGTGWLCICRRWPLG